MSLRERVLVILFVIFSVYMALEYSVHRWMMYPEYVQQEQRQAQTLVEQSVDAIEADFSNFQKQVSAAARSGNLHKTLKNSAHSPALKEEAGTDFVLLYDHQWTPAWNDLTDAQAAKALSKALLGKESAFIRPKQMGFSKKSIYPVNGRYAWVIAEPVLKSNQSHTVEGMVIAGRYLTDAYFQDFKKRQGLSFNWQIVSPNNKLSSQTAEIAEQINSDSPYAFTTLGDNMLQCATLIRDQKNRPALLVKTFQNRDISTQGLHTIYKLMLIKLGTGFAAVLFLTCLLQGVIIKPITKLIKHIGKVEHPTGIKGKIKLGRKDEIGTLAREFDHMCSRVQDAQVKLVEKSYYSGITEMSSGILHNVRNALSPITTRIERIKDQFRDLPLEHLEQAQTELQNGSLSPERRNDLIRFVELTFQNVVNNLKDSVDGLEELSLQVVQIEDMLNAQKTFASKDKEAPIEFIEPIQLVNKALDMVPEKARKLCKIETGRIKKLPAIPVHTTTFTQVLQNLLVNAGESLGRKKTLYPKITISCKIEKGQPVDQLHWKIQDNGAGIEPEKIKAIFERGASSKKTGLTGIGLHWCANTITAMRGKIWAESDGKNRGACFHIVIPMAAEEALATAVGG